MNVLEQIVRTPKPADLALWWKEQSPAATATALEADENDYLEFFTSNSVEPILRIGQGIASQGNLTDERRAYDLPAEGGGVRINGRLYTEHALERMAPDTPQIRAELRARVIGRLKRLGVKPDSEAWNACLARAIKKIDPRGVPPSIVEAEINSPGSTNVKVITARKKTVVVTVIPKDG
ncbi:MAG TPA: hypothetical protein VJV79_26945 [Polyangiaceae bacterium]|nr:hypothetical protein [Polyangiaceae bacterium]